MMDKEALNRDLFDLLLQHAVEDLNAEDEIAAAKEIDSYSDMPDHEFSANFQFNMKKLMKRSKRYQNATPHRRIRNMIGLVATLISMFTFALVVAQAAGFNIFEFLFSATSEYSSVDQIAAMKEQIVAETLAQENSERVVFFPENIPNKFRLTQVELFDTSTRISFENLEGTQKFTIFQTPLKDSSLSSMYDSEQATQKWIKIDGYEAYFVQKNLYTAIGYSNDDIYFTFIFHGVSEKDAIKIASDLEKI